VPSGSWRGNSHGPAHRRAFDTIFFFTIIVDAPELLCVAGSTASGSRTNTGRIKRRTR